MAEPRQRRRRSDKVSERKDPEATRRAILDAARSEFGEHGFSGARVVRIAAAAGVNHQLITYHFGGKQGLYNSVKQAWDVSSQELIGGPDTYADLIREYVRAAFGEQQWAKVLVREELEGQSPMTAAHVADLHRFVEEVRERQDTGEIRRDIDAGVLAFAFFSAAIAPIVMPSQARAFIGTDPTSENFAVDYADQMSKIVSALAGAPDKPLYSARLSAGDAPEDAVVEQSNSRTVGK